MPPRANQVLLILSTLACSWLGMQIVHEFGHVLSALATSGHVTHVVLHPLVLSRTDVSPNPHPLVETWAGPLLGILIPLLALAIASKLKLLCTFVLRFFAGFCLIANGSYLSLGSFDRIGDAGTLLQYGTPNSLLWFFGVLTIPLGLYLWHRQGPHFGFASAQGRVNPRIALSSFILLVLILALEFATYSP